MKHAGTLVFLFSNDVYAKVRRMFHSKRIPEAADTQLRDNDLYGKMKSGMTFTIEPILSEGSTEFTILKDGWTCVSCDGSRSAQFEHTILITDTAADVLTADKKFLEEE